MGLRRWSGLSLFWRDCWLVSQGGKSIHGGATDSRSRWLSSESPWQSPSPPCRARCWFSSCSSHTLICTGAVKVVITQLQGNHCVVMECLSSPDHSKQLGWGWRLEFSCILYRLIPGYFKRSISMFMYVSVWVYEWVCVIYMLALVAGVPGSCELLDMDSENWTWVLSKSSKYCYLWTISSLQPPGWGNN